MVGPTPKPYTGQSVSFKKLKDSFELEDNVEVFHVETSPRQKSSHVTGKLGFSRLLDTVRIISVFVFYLLTKKPDSIYLTKGSTKLGFFRDYALISFKRLLYPKAKFIIHLKGGNYDSFYESCSPRIKELIRTFLSNSDSIIVLGKSLVKMYDFMPELSKKIVVVENALTFDVNATPYVQENEKVSFLFLSNLIYSKGYTHLCEAACMLHNSGVVDFEVVFAGDFMNSPDDPDNVAMYKEDFLASVNNSENNHLKYIGTVSGTLKEETLNSADVLVLPTIYHVEGQPVCIIEAMAYSCAIIATDYRSIPDLVDSTNSKFVQFANVKELVDVMRYLIDDRKALDLMCKYSSDKFRKSFTWDCHYRKISKVIVG